MPEITLTAETGRAPGSSVARRLLAEGKIPGVIYGHGIDPVPVAIEARSLRNALSGEAGLNALLNLKVDGDSHLALAVDLQRHPVRGTLRHVDFQIVRRDEVMTVDVPITLVGDAHDVTSNDGVVAQELFHLTIQTTPANIPNTIEVDISPLQLGESIRVSDVPLPAGVSTDMDPEHAIVTAQHSTTAEVAEAADAEAAEAAAEAAEGEAGAEAAAGGDTAGEGGDAAESGDDAASE